MRKGGAVHSHARTLLAKHGFGDIDRKNHRHDLACSYLGLRNPVLVSVIQSAMPDGITIESASAELEFPFVKGDGKYSVNVGWVDVWARFTARMPSLMAEPVVFRTGEDVRAAREKLMRAKRYDAAVTMTGSAIIEVKIGHVGAGDLVRQMRLYDQHRPEVEAKASFETKANGWFYTMPCAPVRCAFTDEVNLPYFEHHRERAWERLAKVVSKTMVACCDYDMDAEYVRTLKSAGVHAVRLGAGFEAFIREQANSDESVEVLAI